MTKNNFTLLIEKHHSALSEFALKFTRDLDDSQDLMQDTLLKAIRFYQKFDEGTNLKAWLFVIMRNTFINKYRDKRRKQILIIQEEEISSAQLMKSSITNGSISTFAVGDIQKALNMLPKAYSVPFTRYVEGYMYHEIATEMELPLGTVKTRIRKARETLKKSLKLYKERIN